MSGVRKPMFMLDEVNGDRKGHDISADRKYERMMGHYSSKYGTEKGYKKARENIAFAIAHEVFLDSSRTASFYYYAANDALSEGSKELAAELVENADRVFSAWKRRFKIGNAQGYFVEGEIARLKELLRA